MSSFSSNPHIKNAPTESNEFSSLLTPSSKALIEAGRSAGNISADAEELRDGLFFAASRTYAEKYMEPVIRALYGLAESSSNDHDAVDSGTNETYEIKCSKVLTRRIDATNTTLFGRIRAEKLNTELDRVVAYEARYEADYGSNIQNIKRDHFDFLIYGLLFRDCISIFRLPVTEIKRPDLPNWSDIHGRYDAPGMSGQFNINKSFIALHENSYHLDTLTYTDLVPVYKSL
jgi:hypothetical protein